jgi:hypothetical protein
LLVLVQTARYLQSENVRNQFTPAELNSIFTTRGELARIMREGWRM